MLSFPFMARFFFKVDTIAGTLNQKLQAANLPPIGPEYRICPTPRLSFEAGTPTLTVYLQYLSQSQEVQLKITPSNRVGLSIKEANLHCL